MRVFKNRTILILAVSAAVICIIAGAVHFGIWVGNSIYGKITGFEPRQASDDVNPNGRSSEKGQNDNSGNNQNNNESNNSVNRDDKDNNNISGNSGSDAAESTGSTKEFENNIAKIDKVISLINSAERIISKISGNKTNASGNKTDNKQIENQGDMGSTENIEDIKNAVPEEVLEKVEEKADDISRNGKMTFNDYVEIFSIISGKLSLDEIKFLFDTAKGDYWEKTPIEDIYKAREILFSKLSDSDIEKLAQIGKKFGRSMDILKKDLDVEEAKKRQMEAAGLAQ